MAIAAVGHRVTKVWLVRDAVGMVLDRIGLFVLQIGLWLVSFACSAWS